MLGASSHRPQSLAVPQLADWGRAPTTLGGQRRGCALVVSAITALASIAALASVLAQNVHQQRRIAALEVSLTSAAVTGESGSDLRRRAEDQRAAISRLDEERTALARTLAATESPPRALEAPVGELEARLAILTHERDTLARSGRELRSRVGLLEARVAEQRHDAVAEAARMRRWITSQVSSIQGVLDGTGIDVDRLLQRVEGRLSQGQGGPYRPLPPSTDGRRAAGASLVGEQMSRLRAMHVLLRALPLAAPMDVYRTTSPFGVRYDPITGRPAAHEGLDFGGPAEAQALATAPGIVVVAGPLGDYGQMVELDHGMGIQTRYAHLKRVLVEVGERVGRQAPLGVMGSTGRSTGEHLHYEVRVDGVALDPAPILAARQGLRTPF